MFEKFDAKVIVSGPPPPPPPPPPLGRRRLSCLRRLLKAWRAANRRRHLPLELALIGTRRPRRGGVEVVYLNYT